MSKTTIPGLYIEDGAITSDKLASGAVSASSLSSITTDNVSEGSTNTYFTNARARGSVSVTGGNLSYDSGTGVIQLTTDTIRGAISVTDAGGDGSLAYSAGVITYTGPSAAETRAHFSGGTGVTVSSGEISIGQDVATSSTPTFGNITTTGYIAGPATFTIDPAAVGNNTGTVVIAGNLQVDGTTTTINSTTVNVDDLNIQLATGAANAAAANGAGITVDCGSDTDATFTYDGTNDEWDFNKDINVTGTITASGKITSTELTITGGTDGEDIYINNTSPTLGFTDSNSFSDSNDVYLIRGASTGKLQFQFRDDSAGTTTQTFLIDQSGNTDIAGTIDSGAITSTGASSFTDLALGGAADSNYDLKVYGLARFQGTANFVSSGDVIQIGGTTILDSDSNLSSIGTIDSGVITADGLTVQGAAANYNTIQFTSGSTGHGTIINLGDTSDADYGSITQFATSAGEGGRMRFIAGTTETMNLRGGKVGIGETNPSYPFEVSSGSASNVARFKSTGHSNVHIQAGTSSLSQLLFADANDQDAGKISYEHANDALAFRVNTAERMRITSAGRISLSDSEGIKLSAKTSTMYALDGALSYYGTGNGVYLNGAGSNGWLRLNASGVSNNRTAIDLYGINQGDMIQFRAGDDDAMWIIDGGKVGIGVSSPNHKLDVEGGNNVFDIARFGSSASDNSEITIGYFDANATNGIPGLIGASDFGGLIQGGENGHLVLGIRDNDATDALDIVSGGGNFMSDSTYDTLVATFKSNGNVGIGTDSPTHLLHLTSNVPTIKFTESDTSTNAFIQNTGGNLRLYADDGNSRANTVIGFHIDASEKMRIDNSGNIQIIQNTNAPTNSVSLPGYLEFKGQGWDSNSGSDDMNAKIEMAATYGKVGSGATSPELVFSLQGAGGLDSSSESYVEAMRIVGAGAYNSNTPRVGIGTSSPESELQVLGTVSSGTSTKPTHATYDSNGDMMSFEHVFSATKGSSGSPAVNKTLVDISGLDNFHQAIIIVEYGTRLQSVSDSTTGFVHRIYALNRFNGGTLQVTETTALAGSSNSLTHALIDVEIVSNTQYRIRVEFSASIGQSSFASGVIRGYAVSDLFPTISFAEGTGN